MKKKILLITGFDPFGGKCVNASWEAVRRLPGTVGNYEIQKLLLPTRFGEAAIHLLAEAERLRPDAVISVGQAGRRSAITPELVAINLREARIPDNGGYQPVNVPVVQGGPTAYFSTLPVREMVAAVTKAGVPAALSSTAGTFVCNDVFYTLLHRFHATSIPAGFIHVPCLPENAEETSGLSLAQIVAGLTAAIEALP